MLQACFTIFCSISSIMLFSFSIQLLSLIYISNSTTMYPSTHPSRILLLEPVHKRVPVEVWEQILSYLYPSQLSRISMVNKNFQSVVSLLEIWSRMFAIAHGPKAHLRPLLNIPKSKSYMTFMCSSSLHVCESCFDLTEYNASNLSKLPLPIPILLPRRSTNVATYLGEKFDPDWTIRMCLSCRQDHILNREEPYPRLAYKNRLSPSQLRRKYPCAQEVPDLPHAKAIDEIAVIKILRLHFGGDVGVEAYNKSTEEYDEKTKARIRWYQLQD
ncbi:hypothetical protein BKA57DRAFT_240738 [Linnemannia elongata]|nr:hypothetical protein BKA57DRAFT_240738 [Linnemannia elongata]